MSWWYILHLNMVLCTQIVISSRRMQLALHTLLFLRVNDHINILSRRYIFTLLKAFHTWLLTLSHIDIDNLWIFMLFWTFVTLVAGTGWVCLWGSLMVDLLVWGIVGIETFVLRFKFFCLAFADLPLLHPSLDLNHLLTPLGQILLLITLYTLLWLFIRQPWFMSIWNHRYNFLRTLASWKCIFVIICMDFLVVSGVSL